MIGEAVPRSVAHHSPEEALRLETRVGVGGAPTPGPAEPEPGERRLVGADGRDEIRSLHRRAQGDQTSEAVTHHGDRCGRRLRPEALEEARQVIDVPADVGGGSDQPRALVAAAVVGDRGHVVESPNHPPEAVGSIERAVHEHDDRLTARAAVGGAPGGK